MPSKKPKTGAPADPKAALDARVQAGKKVLAKHKDKPVNDDKRRLALKKLKRAQRGLRRIKASEKRAAEAAKKKAQPSA